MDYKNCEEYILSEYLFLREQAAKLEQALNKTQIDLKNANDIITFLKNLFKAELVDGKFELQVSEAVNEVSPQGNFYRDALMGLFGPNQVPLEPQPQSAAPVEPEVKPEN